MQKKTLSIMIMTLVSKKHASIIIKNFFSLTLLFFFCIIIFSCSHLTQPEILRPYIPPSEWTSHERMKSSKLEPKIRGVFIAAERAYKQKKFPFALSIYLQLQKSRKPKEHVWMLSTYRLGSIYYYQGLYQKSMDQFESLLKAPGANTEFGLEARYNIAACLYQLRHYELSLKQLSLIGNIYNASSMLSKPIMIFTLMAQDAFYIRDYKTKSIAELYLLHLSHEQKNRLLLAKNLFSSIQQISNPSDLIIIKNLAHDMAENEVEEWLIRKEEKNKIFLSDHSLNAGANGEEQKNLYPSSIGNPKSIGIILPLSGKYKNLGKKVLDGILVSSQLLTSSHDAYPKQPSKTSLLTFMPSDGAITSVDGIKIYIEDSQSSPKVAENAAQKLINEEVIAIIGPIQWKESLLVSKKCQDFGVLNLSLSSKEGVSHIGPYIFQIGITPSSQLASLVQFAITNKGFRNFGILSPEGGFGDEMAMTFWSLVESYGGKIVEHQTYPRGTKDFQQFVKKILSLSDLRQRKKELIALNQFIEEEKKKSKRTPKVGLPPIYAFDALFVPDTPETTSLISASLNYFDASSIPLLGTIEWNNQELLQRGLSNEVAYYPGLLLSPQPSLPNSDSMEITRMRNYFENELGDTTSYDLLTQEGYDALLLLITSLQKASHPQDRNELQRILLQISNFKSPLGELSFNKENRIAKRLLPIFTTQSN